MERLNGRTVVVTGGAQGIGASYARAIAAEGGRVAICDVQEPTDIVAEIGPRAWGGRCDVTDPGDVAEFVRQTLEHFGRIDGLVNNAALFAALGKNKPFEQIDSDEFDRVMQINVRGVFECTRAVLPDMRQRGYGKVVNVSSGTVFKGVPGKAHYVASKGAVIALSRVMAREVGPDGITVNCIAPGFTLSEGVLDWGEDAQAMNAPNIASRCLPRAQQPDDLNGAVIFLLSSESDFMTGQTMVVDGGSAMN